MSRDAILSEALYETDNRWEVRCNAAGFYKMADAANGESHMYV